MPSLVGSEMCIRDRTGTGPPNHDDSAPRLRLPLSHCHADLPVTPYERMTMLAPRWTTSRSARRLDGLWDFAFDACSLGVTEQWWCDRLPDSRPMPVPASYNDLVVDRGEREYVGDVWYQTRVVVPAGAPGWRTVLRFDAATHRAEVWVNDTRVGTHEGGYTPFEFDISALVSGVDSLRITVRVDNRLTMHSIPPGIVDVDDDGRLRQSYFHDFFNYAGLARSVWLISTPGRYIADIAVRTDLETGRGVVHYEAEIAGTDLDPSDPRPGHTTVVLRDASGASIAASSGAIGSLIVEGAQDHARMT